MSRVFVYMKNVVWKDIKGYEGLYKINNLGQVRSFHNYRIGKINILKPRLKRGYYTVGLRKNGKRKWIGIHRLVAQAFIPNPNNYPCVNHKDENKINNIVENLEWCTIKYNNCYGTRIEKIRRKTGKIVLQYDLEGNFIKEYSNMGEACKENNIKSRSNIHECCYGKYKQAGGYIWRFKGVITR